MTAFWIILACLVIILLTGTSRGSAGRALTTITVLVGAFALIAIANVVLNQFFDMGDLAWTFAAILAGAYAFDAIYGYMAPQRKRRRDRALRDFWNGRRA